MNTSIKFGLVLSLALGLASSSFAQSPKGAEQLASHKSAVAKTNAPSPLVKDTSAATYSAHVRTTIQNPKNGETTAYVVTFRERGFAGNGNLVTMLISDEGQPMAVLSSSTSAGPLSALIQGSSFVGGMYMFGEHLRPSKTENSGGSSSSSATGGNSSNNNANSNTATGGSATGGNGNGGNATGGTGGTGGAAGGHQHPNSPGNGGTPGNGGQNGNGH